MMATWSLREEPSYHEKFQLKIAGFFGFIAIWWMICLVWDLPRSVLPTPLDVAVAVPDLISRGVWEDMWLSIFLNGLSYTEAILIAVPLGFLIGLFGPIKSLTEQQMAGFRYLPITAFISLIITWFGISTLAKVQFLTFGVVVYLLPTTIQRVLEVPQIYVDTAKTAGASRWQRITTVFWPMVSGPLSEDCKNLVPITWTYLILAEGFNLNEGGLGALISNYGRQSRFDYVFALIFIILLIGFIQDRIWTEFNKWRFPWLYK